MGTLKVNNIQSVTDGSVTFPQGSNSSQPVTFPSGTASNPSISFTGDTDTGLYRSAINQISLSTAGTERARIDNSGLEIIDGTASNPSLSFLNDSDTGLYRIDANKIGISTGGNKVGEIGAGYGGFTGNIIQVVNFENSYGHTITNYTSWSSFIQSASGIDWEVSITPKYENSKIIIFRALNGNTYGSNTYIGFGLNRKIGSGVYSQIYTPVVDSNGAYEYGTGSLPSQYNVYMNFYVDSPNSKSEIKYKFSTRVYGSGQTYQSNSFGSVNNGKSFILLAEVQQ